jgi:hypothetical protein
MADKLKLQLMQKLKEQQNQKPKDKEIEEISNKTPEELKRDELRKKLYGTINAKKQIRSTTSRKEIKEQTTILKDIMKHPQMNPELLKLYGKAIEFNPTKKLPTPLDIFNNTNNYKVVYYQYIHEMIKELREKNIGMDKLNDYLDNPYSHYMAKCIGCPINPFANTNANTVKEDNSDNEVPTLLDPSNANIVKEDNEVPTLLDPSNANIVKEDNEVPTLLDPSNTV